MWAGSNLIGFAFYLPTIAGVTLTDAPAGSVLPGTYWTPNTDGAALLTTLATDGFKGPGGTQVANFGLDRTDLGTGNMDSSNLTFDITATGLSTSSFHSWLGNDQATTPVYFIADICVPDVTGACTGNTGLVGATLTNEEQPPGVPLPATVWLMGSVLGGGAGLGAWRKRRKKEKQAA